MHPDFDLVVTADGDALTADLRLLDSAGSQIAYNEVDIRNIAAATRQGLFDLREFVQTYAARPGESGRTAEEMVADLGVSLAEDVLGAEIFGALSKSTSPRTLRVCLPIAQTPLAAALARVPWEIARASRDGKTLAENNLIVRAIVGGADPERMPLVLDAGEALRVLFIFAEAPGSRPLAARQEREQLKELFEKEVYPHRRIEADFLAHGVTRERLTGMISDRHGYHIVHWSGHGHRNLLELAGTDGKPDRLSGQDLVELLIDAGGFKPQLFFLSACHSGDVVRITDWESFQAVAAGRDPQRSADAVRETELRDKLEETTGYTGTAHALLRAGVPSVVAMRYSVGDDYARDLAVDFYRATLAATNPPSVAEALNVSRKRLRNAGRDDDKLNYAACDYATPVFYGLADPSLPLPKGKSAYKNRRDPLGARIAELDIRSHPHFVGRTWELAGLGAHFIGYQKSASVQQVAVIQGMGGMGKTSLAAEALDLWSTQFDWVLTFQAKPNALNLDNTLREIHELLWAELKTYHAHAEENPADAIWRPAEGEGEHAFRGERRLQRLCRNLVRAMEDEAILLVLDNFETNLKETPVAASSSELVWACQDPEWDWLLAMLATDLRDTASRVLITCRRPLAALSKSPQYPCILGPLPPGEAALYLREHPALRQLMFSKDKEDQKLLSRISGASRFHPLLLDRLARLVAGGSALRAQLGEALQALESTDGYDRLPQLFAARPAGVADAKELDYLNDALQSSIDLLLEHAGSDARLLLWILALANDPVALGLLRGVWSGESEEEQFSAVLDIEPLLSLLITVGLVTAEQHGPIDENPDFTCHELVRERIAAWRTAHPDERMGREENAVRLAYAERLVQVFYRLLHQDAPSALEAGRRALVYCVQAGAYDKLGSFAGMLVTSTTDPRLLNALLPHLDTAARSAPAGKPHWSCLTYLADALRNAGRPDASLPFYEQAGTEAAEAEHWRDVSWITGNWANALGDTGHLDASRAKHLDSAEAKRRAGNPLVSLLGSELEAYRVDIMHGRASEVLPEIEQRIAQVESWWQRTRRGGERVPEAPDVEELGRVLISALDVARGAHFAQKDWEAALPRIDRILEVMRELHRPAQDIAGNRMNRANVLLSLRRYGQAQAELEACLEIFAGDARRSLQILGSLADLFDDRGDVLQALELQRRGLAMSEQLPDPVDRAISHNNLAIYLAKTGSPSALAESACHRLADLAYVAVAGMKESVQTSLSNYAIDFRRAKAAGTGFTPPRLAGLLVQPAFRPLAQWLDQRGVNREELQSALDQLLERAREAGES
jgi:tetratricopeptide (TPR) repeat protein